MSDRRTADNGKDYFRIPDSLFDTKYRGCGKGRIVVDKATDTVIDMDYLDKYDRKVKVPDGSMHRKAGEVLKETRNRITYRVNFSSGSACLF